jgi:hypothetical protein
LSYAEKRGVKEEIWKFGRVFCFGHCAGAIAIQLIVFHAPMCGDFVCFQESMMKCKPARFVNDENQATWLYEILGKEEGDCEVNVKLIQAKEGVLELTGLQDMTWSARSQRHD